MPNNLFQYHFRIVNHIFLLNIVCCKCQNARLKLHYFIIIRITHLFSGWSQSQQQIQANNLRYDQRDINASFDLPQQNSWFHPFHLQYKKTTTNNTTDDSKSYHPIPIDNKRVKDIPIVYNGRKLLSTINGGPNIYSNGESSNDPIFHRGSSINKESYRNEDEKQKASHEISKSKNGYNYQSHLSHSSFR